MQVRICSICQLNARPASLWLLAVSVTYGAYLCLSIDLRLSLAVMSVWSVCCDHEVHTHEFHTSDEHMYLSVFKQNHMQVLNI